MCVNYILNIPVDAFSREYVAIYYPRTDVIV